MASDSSALTTTPSPPLPEADYEAISAAVMETARGRWFLAEYARRNRSADTLQVLAAIERIEATLHGEPPPPSERMRGELLQMSQTIARGQSEIAALKPNAERAGAELSAAAELIQEVACAMREQGLDRGVCDLLDARTGELYAACTSQKLNGQHIGTLIELFAALERRVEALIATKDDAPAAAPVAAAGKATPADDRPEEEEANFWLPEAEPVAATVEAKPADPPPPAPPPAAPSKPIARPRARRKPDDPLAPLATLSDEEKIALFS